MMEQLVLSHFLEKLILRKNFKVNFKSELCQKTRKQIQIEYSRIIKK